jgi:hypothetical protein
MISEIAEITEFWLRLSAVGGASPWPGWGVCFRQAPQTYFTTKTQRTQSIFLIFLFYFVPFVPLW